MPAVCLNTSEYSISDLTDMITAEAYNSSSYQDGVSTTPGPDGLSDPGDPLVYILAVLSFYVLSITLLMAKSIHGGREEKNYEDYLQNFIKRDKMSRNDGYMPSAIKTDRAKDKNPPARKAPVVLPGKPARTALKQPQSDARPKSKETVRLIEPGEVERVRAFNKKRQPHRNLEPVLMTSV